MRNIRKSRDNLLPLLPLTPVVKPSGRSNVSIPTAANVSVIIKSNSWSFKSVHSSRSLTFEGPIASKWSVSEKSHSSPVGSSSFITDCGTVPGTPSQSVLHAREDSRDCFGGGVSVCFPWVHRPPPLLLWQQSPDPVNMSGPQGLLLVCFLLSLILFFPLGCTCFR